jgi:hypothetical protein
VTENGLVTIKSGTINLGATYDDSGLLTGYNFSVDSSGNVTMLGDLNIANIIKMTKDGFTLSV